MMGVWVENMDIIIMVITEHQMNIPQAATGNSRDTATMEIIATLHQNSQRSQSENQKQLKIKGLPQILNKKILPFKENLVLKLMALLDRITFLGVMITTIGKKTQEIRTKRNNQLHKKGLINSMISMDSMAKAMVKDKDKGRDKGMYSIMVTAMHRNHQQGSIILQEVNNLLLSGDIFLFHSQSICDRVVAPVCGRLFYSRLRMDFILLLFLLFIYWLQLIQFNQRNFSILLHDFSIVLNRLLSCFWAYDR